MALVNQTLPGLYGGVSQQTPELRFDTQVTEMVNCYPTVVGGVSKRPPSELLYQDNTFPTDAFTYVYDRGTGDEQYVICITTTGTLEIPAGSYRIFDIVKNKWVIDWTPDPYLNIPLGAKAKDSFALSTVGDTTFVVNKTITCAMSGVIDDNGDPDWDSTFYYWVKRTNGDDEDNKELRYTYYIYDENGNIAGHTTHHKSTIAAPELAIAVGSNATHKGSVAKVTNATGFSGADSWGNQASRSWVGKIKKLQDLPNDFGFEGAVIEVSGDDNTGFDNYYVKYEGGVFLETFKPGLDNSFDASTMPHKLGVRRNTDGETYTTFFDPIEWGDRKVGDLDSAGEPSFIGQPIQDVFFYRNRLGFLCGDNVVLSESGEYYNFFPTTVTSIIDSDVVDVAVDSNQAIALKYATPFNKELLIFGNKAQFVMSASDVLTPTEVSVQQSTAFDITDVKPIILGPNSYFTTEKNNYSSLREYYVQPDSLSNTAADITSHCPNYLPKNITKLTGSSQNDMLFALSSDTPNSVYVYNFYWNGEEKVQSAWHKWTFDGELFNIDVIGSYLFVMLKRSGDINFEKIPLEFRLDFNNVLHADLGTANYESQIILTRPGFPTGKAAVDDTRGNFIIRNIQFNADYNSFYNVISHRFSRPPQYLYNSISGVYTPEEYITSKEYNFTTVLGASPDEAIYKMNTDHRYSITGNRDNIELEITNNITAGFRINSLDIRGTYIKRSRNV